MGTKRRSPWSKFAADDVFTDDQQSRFQALWFYKNATLHKPCERIRKDDFVIRPWCPEDEGGVWKVLKDGSFSNILPSFFLSLRKIWTAVIICLIGSYVFATSSLMSALVAVVMSLCLLYLLMCVVALFYVYGPPLDDMKEVTKTYFSREDTVLFVAELMGKIVGTIALVHRPNSRTHTQHYVKISDQLKVAWLRRMAVLRECRGKGIAKTLLETSVEFCRSHDYDKIQLITTEIHQPARRLYEKFGFQCTAFRPYKYLRGFIRIWTYEYELQL